MNEKPVVTAVKDPDMYNFEKRLRETLHELSLKRGLLEESRKELNQTYLIKYELERRLDRVCRELDESRGQLEVAVAAGRKWEKEREAVPLHRAHLQAALTERDSLKEEARTLQLENVKLKQKVEEMEGQLHCLSTFQNTSAELQNKVEETMREIKRQVQCLSQDQKRLERSVKASSNLSSRLELATRHFNCVHEKLSTQLKNMENNTILLTTELDKLKNGAKDNNLPEHSTEENEGLVFKEWKNALKEMESRLLSSEECKKNLQKAFDSSLQMSEKFQKEAKTKDEENSKLRVAKDTAERKIKDLQIEIMERMKVTKDEEAQVDMTLIDKMDTDGMQSYALEANRETVSEVDDEIEAFPNREK